MTFEEARKIVEEIWSRLPKSEQRRLWNFFHCNGEQLVDPEPLEKPTSGGGPGAQLREESLLTMAVSGGVA